MRKTQKSEDDRGSEENRSKNEEDFDLHSIATDSSDDEEAFEEDLQSSDTDEDENEGLGDGNMGRPSTDLKE